MLRNHEMFWMVLQASAVIIPGTLHRRQVPITSCNSHAQWYLFLGSLTERQRNTWYIIL